MQWEHHDSRPRNLRERLYHLLQLRAIVRYSGTMAGGEHELPILDRERGHHAAAVARQRAIVDDGVVHHVAHQFNAGRNAFGA
jgi:hypothetical protein